MFHILAQTVQGLQNGVEVSSQGDIKSKTLVCYLDSLLNFHYGFAFKNGSNLRVVCWENNGRKNKTVPTGSFVIAFKDFKTQKKFQDVNAQDFNIRWFTQEARQEVQNELEALNRKRDELDDTINRLAGLTIQELDVINKKIDKLHPQA